jgi:hypothetical protein
LILSIKFGMYIRFNIIIRRFINIIILNIIIFLLRRIFFMVIYIAVKKVRRHCNIQE